MDNLHLISDTDLRAVLNQMDKEQLINSLIAKIRRMNSRQKIFKNDDDIMSYIISQVSKSFGIKEMDLRSKSRQFEIVQARFMAFRLAKTFTKLPLKSIGSHFSNRDHTTIIHGLNSISDFLESRFKKDKPLQEIYFELEYSIEEALLK